MSTLVQLGLLRGTDKGTRHTYLEVYESLMAPQRDRTEPVLELGCLAGQSLLMWQDWFTNAPIVGVDVNPCPVSGNRIRVHQYDAYCEATLHRLQGRYCVIVDDGPHTLESMLFVVSKYSLMLASGGLLVVEDVPDPKWIPQIASAVPEHLKRFMYSVDRNFVPGSASRDDLLFVLDLPASVSGAVP